MKNRNFRLIVGVFAALNGIFIGVGTTTDPFFSAFGFNTTYISIFAGVFVIAGVMTSILAGVIIDKTGRLLMIIRVVCIGSTVCFCVLYIAFKIPETYVMALNMIACGSFLIPMIPVCISFAGEVTFPLPEAVSVGILMMAGQLSGLVFGFIGTFIFEISSLSGVRQA